LLSFFSELSHSAVCFDEFADEPTAHHSLSICYQRGCNPAVYPFIAILICLSKQLDLMVFKQPPKDPVKKAEFFVRRFLDHFRAALGKEMEFDLARKMRDHVRQLAAEVVTKAEKKLSEEQNRDKKAKTSQVKDADYYWLLFRLRNFVFAYSLLDDFFEQNPKLWQRPENKADKNSPVVWPLVCLFFLQCSIFSN
jgi:hypothetical protein